MFAKQLRNGAMVNGRRVVAMSPGLLNGRKVISVRYSDGEPATYGLNDRVPDSLPRTDLIAGPTHLEPGRRARWISGARSTGRVGRFDGDSAGDRHSRLMDGLVYTR